MKRISDEKMKELAIKGPYGFQDLIWIAQHQLDSCEEECKEQVKQAIGATTTAYESTCEALIKEKVQEIFEWGMKPCWEHSSGGVCTRRECPICWQVKAEHLGLKD